MPPARRDEAARRRQSGLRLRPGARCQSRSRRVAAAAGSPTPARVAESPSRREHRRSRSSRATRHEGEEERGNRPRREGSSCRPRRVIVHVECPSETGGAQGESDQIVVPLGSLLVQRAGGFKVLDLLAWVRARAQRPDLATLSLPGGARLWPADLVEHVIVPGETLVAAAAKPARSGRP